MTNSQLNQQKLAMEQMLREVTGDVSFRETLQIETYADALDQIQSAAERDFAVIRMDQKNKLARELRTALQKITDGSYGVCEECDEPIAPRRLDVLPFAKLCVRCQEQHEAQGHDTLSEDLLEEAA